MKIIYFDRVSKKMGQEKVYGALFLDILYGKQLWKRALSLIALPLFAGVPFFSKLYGWFQKSHFSRYKVRPFIHRFDVDASEFSDPVDSFRSFNDFFIRKLDLKCRPMAEGKEVAVLPADARYLVFPRIDQIDHFFVKGHPFSLEQLLQDKQKAAAYREGSMVIARLCPVDYHRFHFPCDGVAGMAEEIPGPLFSVNPIALKKDPTILSRNKRVITPFKTPSFGTILYIEIGATYVGSIHQTFEKGKMYKKGDEKGFFSFGGSSLILLFEPGKIHFEEDLLRYSSRNIEVRGLFGDKLGKSG
ncbi:MAG: phosphatidylserine decarboxylase proenzyme [Chlamydiota bacterium]|jgi:phosphatidylserine decarboxylase